MRKTRKWLVLKPVSSTYEIVTGPATVDEVLRANKATRDANRAPDIQIVEITDICATNARWVRK